MTVTARARSDGTSRKRRRFDDDSFAGSVSVISFEEIESLDPRAVVGRRLRATIRDNSLQARAEKAASASVSHDLTLRLPLAFTLDFTHEMVSRDCNHAGILESKSRSLQSIFFLSF